MALCTHDTVYNRCVGAATTCRAFGAATPNTRDISFQTKYSINDVICLEQIINVLDFILSKIANNRKNEKEGCGMPTSEAQLRSNKKHLKEKLDIVGYKASFSMSYGDNSEGYFMKLLLLKKSKMLLLVKV